MAEKITEEKLRRNPIEKANLLSRLFFWWTLGLFKKGAQNGITADDLYTPLASDKSETLTDDLERAWNDELKKLEVNENNQNNVDNRNAKSPKPSLLRAIIKTFWLKYAIIGVFQIIEQVILFNLQPVILSKLIDYFENDNSMTKKEVLSWAAALITVTLGSIFIMQHTHFFAQILGMRIRVACCSLIYRKSLKLSKPALDQTSVGQAVNLLSNDANRFDLQPLFFNYLWITPIQIVVIGYIVWRRIGIYTLVGYGVLFLITIPMQGYVGAVTGKLRNTTAKLTDRRVQLINEIIFGIQVIKMYVWEKPFEEMAMKARAKEMKQILHSNNIKGLYSNLWELTQKIMTFTTIAMFILNGNQLPIRIAFQIPIYYNTLQVLMTILFPMSILISIQTFIVVQRIEKFLLLEEVTESTKVSLNSNEFKVSEVNVEKEKKSIPGAVVVELNKVSANWKFGQLPPTLCDVTLKINGGELCTLVGPVGSGKSSLLNLLLQELPVGAGTVGLFQFPREESADARSKSGFIQDNPEMKISYASQDPWLFTGTVRENILFGQDYDKARYEEVTKVCSLLRDFKQLPDGDKTIVGERGASLSGGQRARVNLARAIYRPADLYLLDDPLSAVDARVARRLFQDCILGYLKGKTRILVTHQLDYLEQVDTIAVLECGSITHQDTMNTLTTVSPTFNNMVNALTENKNKVSNIVIEHDDDVSPPASAIECATEKNDFFRRLKARMSQVSIKSQDSYKLMTVGKFQDPNAKDDVPDEVIGSGFISKEIYFRYFREGGGTIGVTLLALMFIVTTAASIGVDQWMAYWTTLETFRSCIHSSGGFSQGAKHESNSLVNNTIFDPLLDADGLLPANMAVYIYLALLITFVTLSMSRCYFLILIGMRAARRLHNLMFANVLRATMYFFNTNPSGRLLNRFSKDVGTMDDSLLPDILQAAIILSAAMATLINIIIVNPWMMILALIVGILYYFSIKFYLKTAQDVKRLESAIKSRVLSHVSTSFDGLPTIRSRDNAEKIMLRNNFDRYQDDHTRAWYLMIATGSAFGLGIDLMACFFIAVLSFLLIIFNVDGPSAGLAISQSLSLTGMLQHGVKQATKVQSQMTAVERIIQYTDLPKEGPIESSKPLPENWPSKGRMQWKNVYLSYKEGDPPVLKNIDLMIEPGWKVGVVGRTGAGKSSLISALFRLVDDGLKGQIIIDDIDTKTIGLQDLRSSISIIPQEPVLFSETLRYNLDPFDKYTDKDIWDALREVELSDLALDQWVTEGGTNFSVGQRQLICLARALLRNNRILILDEATANIDSRTDALIQRAIRSKFADCTVITIAHRLNTIINSDRVLVMDNGCVAEFDTPHELLLKKPDSIFSKMVQQTGPTMAAKITQEVMKLHPQQTDILPSAETDDSNLPHKNSLSHVSSFYDTKL
ncbi:ATP-binding cassette subfamily C member 4-like [Microplitis demolitor]|uniref:ATP-binding cassette subfamily C member 4-like n=1 Tax=Microplitis demolitor TaxID=69319 RepID=UPI0004CD51F3|nr:ATP-binding cassette subfamily C member 4-like [Microplitis demolitor]XP_053595921.1 ATP-binding cassette subfamily C member 4-like [Microplitis demolitor]XP_053595922.1 ATP-binding cassette subfamily C member 4-like [Microplitis demolitor]XP_053595923.1 ATP-binding cassette subfamily C member 4-like [Microplitis demolitor]